MQKLLDILSHRRQHGSAGVEAFAKKYLNNFLAMRNAKGEILAYVTENSKDHKPVPILWSCHIDTMHRKSPETVMQAVIVNDNGIASVTDKECCLGADNGAGAWLMLEMIEAGVEGTFIFHAGEEIGCFGSKGLAREQSTWLAQFTHAIAFDRRGTKSIITHQLGQQACSNTLGNKLIELLGMNHKLDPTGVYTDTAEYMELIPECVNISIGYDNEHGSRETLDTKYLMALRDSIVKVDWANAALPVDRDPSVVEDYRGWGRTKGLDTNDIPTLNELMTASFEDITDWVAYQDIETVAWLIQDLVAASMQLNSASIFDDDDDEDFGRLNLGMR